MSSIWEREGGGGGALITTVLHLQRYPAAVIRRRTASRLDDFLRCPLLLGEDCFLYYITWRLQVHTVCCCGGFGQERNVDDVDDLGIHTTVG